MEQYNTSTPLPQRQTRLGGPGEAVEEPAIGGEPTCADLLAAIQGFRVALEGKIETVAVEVNLLRDDLCKATDDYRVHIAMKWLSDSHRERLMALLHSTEIISALKDMPSGKFRRSDSRFL
ncbi:hypothetical protein NDU88_004916 [Pleurodeles waltl]|uniref:Uncharacterized protein n=1 Tax=Pleurodeles waltl TaxID=8319 RepID=A0AAV7LJI6_PLEWA|nr:hypothetical protein NDU88_004916 [Pleurodeles waltl]